MHILTRRRAALRTGSAMVFPMVSGRSACQKTNTKPLYEGSANASNMDLFDASRRKQPQPCCIFISHSTAPLEFRGNQQPFGSPLATIALGDDLRKKATPSMDLNQVVPSIEASKHDSETFPMRINSPKTLLARPYRSGTPP